MAKLAVHARVNRVNAYGAIRHLLTLGLITQEIKGRKRGLMIAPASLDHLLELARTHQKRASSLRWKIEELIPALAKLDAHPRAQEISARDVLFFRGPDAFLRIAERTLLIGAGKTACFIEPYGYFVAPGDTPYRDYDREYYIPTRVVNGISLRVLYKPNTQGRNLQKRDKQELRETRFLPKNLDFPCSIYLYGDEVALLWTTDQMNAVVVRGGPLVALMQMMFEMVWTQSKK